MTRGHLLFCVLSFSFFFFFFFFSLPLLDVRGKKSVVSVEPSDSIQKAMDKMIHHKCGSVCVMNQREMVGIFTDADIGRVVRSEVDPTKSAVEDFMSQNVITGKKT